MYEQIEKPKENKSRAVANSVAQKKSNVKKGFRFVDNRPEFIAQRKVQGMVQNHIEQLESLIQRNNTGLPDNLKSGMESLSGMSLDHVKVHRNSSKPAAVQAHAYAQGSDIHLASGQEKHLPHELGHVVQQAQGRVKPTTTVGGMSVNDNAGLESEATVMGNKALQMKTDSSAIKQRQVTHSDNSEVSNQTLIQRAEVKTFGGTYKTNGYDLTFHAPREGGDKGVGCSMNLEFKANDAVDCAQIGLTQTTTPTVKKGGNSHETYAAARGVARATEDNVEGDLVDTARYLDRTDKNVHPVFGAQNPLNAPDLIPESFHSDPDDKLGAHTLNEIGAVTSDEAAALLDTPGRDWRQDWTVIQSFETSALCLSGPMKGDYLGSVEWGYKYGPQDQGAVIPLTKISDAMPSEKFLEAVVNWNNTKIPQQYGADKDTVPLPENERLRTNDALSLPHRKHMLDEISTLSQHSVLNLLQGADFSKHSKQLLLNRLYSLMSVSSLVFTQSWLAAYEQRGNIRGLLETLRDEYAKKEAWNSATWSLDDSVREAIGKETPAIATANDLTQLLLPSAVNSLVFFCLNPSFNGATQINDNVHFDVPSCFLNATALGL
ncbi:eCIS core domain-containing protein [Shewanella psychropiezotolerans]|uniref:eCIS core domain-containing protein n=1 Tax=Shewanella psychropiezotolerans TaxID=2593655 RepID=UPI001C8F7622|nr:DUF4157 domain-containing protein [Shewanella psychropiezotolerans]